MYVVATAGHVDHGKSTLVRALTGMEPDRWAEERRRGLTIDLGFAWTALDSGRQVAFVDVPGHQRFLGNMLAGLGPAPVVCFVVAADQGWQAQSGDHRDAVAALGIRHGLLVISRADRAPDGADAVRARARAELAATGLRDAPAVTVSALDGTGLPELRTALDGLLAGLPAPAPTDRLRLWVDRSFSVAGAGTVLTGTLTAGGLAVGDRLQVLGRDGQQQVVVRGLESLGEKHSALTPVSRVAVNLRAVAADGIRRGDALVTPDAWPTSAVLDVRRSTGDPLTDAPERLTVHAGTATVPARLRPFDGDHARLTLARPLPLGPGDRLVLHDPGSHRLVGGALVLDADPPSLHRRGDRARRATTLAGMGHGADLLLELARRGAVSQQRLRRLGLLPVEPSGPDGTGAPEGVRVVGDWWIHPETYASWQRRLMTALDQLQQRDPLSGGLSRGAASDLLGLEPDAAADRDLLTAVGRDAGLEYRGGYFRLPGSSADLGAAEDAVVALEQRLTADPFRAPEADELTALQLGARQLAAAERAGRLLRVADGIVLLPTAPALAMRELSRLQQPFTTSAARQALATSRRVAIPLLELLDGRGWTRRLDAGHREVVRGPAGSHSAHIRNPS